MPKIQYQQFRFRADTLKLIQQANDIIAEYQRQGFQLTLRQLYYQFVSRDLIANKTTEYKRLGSVINDARLAGKIDWNAIVDRTRNLQGESHWETPGSIMESAAYSYRIDKWITQEYRPEVWIEKDALVGVISGTCRGNDISYFSCRGYTSQSEMWEAGQRLRRYTLAGQTPVVIHLGDHDPSGKDMTRDIEERLSMFAEGPVIVERIALNFDQIQVYNPPPNPAKETDSRFEGYRAEFGDESWELDALEPTVIARLIEEKVVSYKDMDRWAEEVDKEKEQREQLKVAARRWAEIADFLEE